MSNVAEVTDQNFKEKVINSDKPVLVDFWAPWCMPCRMMGPVFEDTAKSFDGKVDFLKMNTDSNQTTAMDIGIMSIPSLVLFKGGKEVDRLIGVQSPESLQTAIDNVL